MAPSVASSIVASEHGLPALRREPVKQWLTQHELLLTNWRTW